VSFERRLLVALALFSLVPSFALIGAGTVLLLEAVELHTAPETWESVRRSGLELLDGAERSGDPGLARAADRHRAVLTASLEQSRRWEFLNRRVLQLIPVVAVLLAALLFWLAVRFARGIARELSRPTRELVEWSGKVARGEALPPPTAAPRETGEFTVLRDAFREMAAELRSSRERALEAERNRSWVTMARGVAHELKNSLTPLRLAVRALEAQTAALPATREALEVVAGESARLEELARSFAQFGRLPEGPVSEIDLPEQLEYLLRTHLPPGVEHRLRAPLDLPRIHMSESGGMVTVKMTALGDAVEVRVLDTGPGIAPENLERIWEPDFSTKARGTGLGLALVRTTVQAHGGGVWARNRPEGGAEFRVVLPKSYRLSAIGYRSSEGEAGSVPDVERGATDSR
jgi:signal transduction histidine kinase